MSLPVIGVIVPCYNEEKTIDLAAESIGEELKTLIQDGVIEAGSFVCFVDDGSRDGTWTKIETWRERGTYYRGLKLSRNVGQQRALLAGLMEMRSDAYALISMDADLRDPASTIPRFVDEYLKGFEIVYGVREDLSPDAAPKSSNSPFFYRVMKALGVELIENHTDCRLLGSRALEALSHFDETNLFLRGIVPMLGYPSTKIYYRPSVRIAGKAKRSLLSRIAFSWNGITSSSAKPIALIAWVGAAFCLGAIGGTVWVLSAWHSDDSFPGWRLLLVALLFVTGVQLLGMGLIGQYLGKIYSEVKRRPPYFVEKRRE